MTTDQEYRSLRTVDKIEYSTTKMKYPSSGLKIVKISKNTDNISFIGNNNHTNSLKTTLTNANLGTETTQIPEKSFLECKKLTTVNVPLKCKSIGDYAFKGCENLKNINILNGGSYSVQLIGNHAFDGCKSIENVNINLERSDSMNYHIGDYAFANCTSLSSVSWQNQSYLADHMFYGCTNLTSLSILNDVSYMFPYCLAGLQNINSIRIPSNIWILNDYCFYGDTSLTSVTIEDSSENKSVMDHVGKCVFDGCNNLTTITFPESITDMSCFETNSLYGSSISRVVLKGMDDEKFVTNYRENIEIQNTGFIRTFNNFNLIQDNIANHNIPVVFITNYRRETNITQGGARVGLSGCQSLAACIRSNRWKDYMQDHSSSAYFVYAALTEDDALWKAISYRKNLNETILEKMPAWAAPSSFAKVMALMIKEDGTVVAKTYVNAIYTVDDLINKVDSVLRNFEGQITNPELNVQITKLGSPLESITYVSKQGHEFECTTQSKVEYTPEVRVDKLTSSDFKYGTWYYNAKELRKYADDNNIPVFVEYSPKGCKPCDYFSKNVYNNVDFQTWVNNSKYLFCRIEVNGNEGFNQPKKYPQPYYVNYIWAKEKYGKETPFPPVLMWYWKKSGETQASIWEIKSYYFNPMTDATPPYSVDELKQMTDDYFTGYVYDVEKEKKIKENIYTSTNRHMGYSYINENGDENGKYFVCDYRYKIKEYSSRIDIKGYQVLSRISEGMTVDFPENTYQYFTASDQNYPDMEGIIFKVIMSGSNRKISYIYEFQNNYDYKKDQKYLNAVWYNLDETSETGLFTDMIQDSESMDYSVIILKVTNNTECDSFKTTIKNSNSFQEWVSQKHQTYFIEIKVNNSDFSTGLGKEFRDFYDTSWRQMPTWNDSMPQFIIYESCGSCSSSDTPTLTLHSNYIPGNDDVERIKTTLDSKLNEISQ